MADVKALFPIGKTQWAKWDNTKREAFNTLRADGHEFNAAVQQVNAMPKAVRIIDVFHEVEDIVEEVAPVIAAVVKAVRRPRTKKVK